MEFLTSSFGEFIFIAGLITLGLSLILRIPKILFIQAGLLVVLIFVPSTMENLGLSYLLFLVQLTLIAFALFKYKRSVDFNYQLILEKTHQIPRKITVGGNFGDEK